MAQKINSVSETTVIICVCSDKTKKNKNKQTNKQTKKKMKGLENHVQLKLAINTHQSHYQLYSMYCI